MIIDLTMFSFISNVLFGLVILRVPKSCSFFSFKWKNLSAGSWIKHVAHLSFREVCLWQLFVSLILYYISLRLIDRGCTLSLLCMCCVNGGISQSVPIWIKLSLFRLRQDASLCVVTSVFRTIGQPVREFTLHSHNTNSFPHSCALSLSLILFLHKFMDNTTAVKSIITTSSSVVALFDEKKQQ